jgi:hypothetical protein
MAMGILIERLDDDQHAARGELADVFAQFASKSQRRQVEEMFS